MDDIYGDTDGIKKSILDNLKTLLPKKDIDLLNKSFEKSDNETVISLLENILKDLNAK